MGQEGRRRVVYSSGERAEGAEREGFWKIPDSPGNWCLKVSRHRKRMEIGGRKGGTVREFENRRGGKTKIERHVALNCVP